MASGAASRRSPCFLPCLYVKGISQCLYHPIYSPILPHQFCQTPLWASRASWMTVSMWQSSLKWKGSRRLGFCASFTKLGFHPLHSVCQWLGLWMKAFETMPASAVSDQWASAVVRCGLRCFGVHLEESQQRFFGRFGAKRKGRATALSTSGGWLRWRGERGEESIKAGQLWFDLAFCFIIFSRRILLVWFQDSEQVKHLICSSSPVAYRDTSHSFYLF